MSECTIPFNEKRAIRRWYFSNDPRPTIIDTVFWYFVNFRRSISPSTVAYVLSYHYDWLDAIDGRITPPQDIERLESEIRHKRSGASGPQNYPKHAFRSDRPVSPIEKQSKKAKYTKTATVLASEPEPETP